tara:strand:- start:132 stop:1307 length:1176 start_codon:yes stop_codon:yes gene_type:complete
MEQIILGIAIGVVIGFLIHKYLISKKDDQSSEVINELNFQINDLRTKLEVKNKELELQKSNHQEQLAFKQEMLDEIAKSVKDTTKEEQAPYITNLIEQSEKVKNDATQLENDKKDFERDKKLAERKNDEALIKGKYSINVRGVNSEDVMQQVILNSGFVEGKNVQFRKKQDGISGIPDATLIYPKGRKVICDSKAPLDKFDEIIEAGQIGDKDKITKLKSEFGKSVINHIDDLSGKEYQNAKDSMDFIIMFLPSETHVHVARDCLQLHQKDLDEYAMDKNIMIVGPSSFYPYVNKINELWKHHENIESRDKALKILKGAFKAMRIIAEKIEKTKRKINDAADEAEDLDKSYNSTFKRAGEKVQETGYSDEEIDKVTKDEAEIIDIKNKKNK